MSVERLSELECCVLAVIGDEAPCTRYAVLKVFAQSDTTRWSSTAGSIYPLIARMAARGLVREQGDQSQRGARLLALTEAGAARVAEWIAGDQEVIGRPNDDPIRTRAYFLSALPPADQAATLLLWTRKTREHLATIDRRLDECRRAGRVDHARAYDGTRRQLVARLEWLDEAFRDLSAA